MGKTMPTEAERIRKELDAVQTAYNVLVILDQPGRVRALRWLDAKLADG